MCLFYKAGQSIEKAYKFYQKLLYKLLGILSHGFKICYMHLMLIFKDRNLAFKFYIYYYLFIIATLFIVNMVDSKNKTYWLNRLIKEWYL